jgi:hypothetical protein
MLSSSSTIDGARVTATLAPATCRPRSGPRRDGARLTNGATRRRPGPIRFELPIGAVFAVPDVDPVLLSEAPRQPHRLIAHSRTERDEAGQLSDRVVSS